MPQGSVLGPLLFLLFINDLCNLSTKHSDIKLKPFADDVKLYAPTCSQSQSNSLQRCLDDISAWCASWQLNLAPQKCVVLSLGHKTTEFIYSINGIALKHVNNYDDLGICIEKSLNFDGYINKICTKANQRAALILKTFTSRNPRLLYRAFTTFVRPILEYSSSLWSPNKLYLIDKIESVQKRFTKKLMGLSLKNYSALSQYR